MSVSFAQTRAPSMSARSSSLVRPRRVTIANVSAQLLPRMAPRRQQLCCQAVAAGDASASTPSTVPRSSTETVQQAVAACERAWADGKKRQRVELLLPLIGATGGEVLLCYILLAASGKL